MLRDGACPVTRRLAALDAGQHSRQKLAHASQPD